MYFVNVIRLVAARRITLATAIYALRERPIAVAGKRGGYVVDPNWE